MASSSHFHLIYIVSGIVCFLVFVLFFVLIHKWKNKKTFAFNSYPSIILTSHDSPQLKEKKLWSPPDLSKQRQGKKKVPRSDRKEKVRSYWFPKRDIKPFLPSMKGEFQQPSHAKQSDETVKGRLKFSFGYDFNMERQKSILTVRLHHGRDYTHDLDDLSMDTFVKTRLLPSERQTFTSKLQRRTLNPNYNECYNFDIEYSELLTQVLCFEVFCFDCLSRFEIFGEVILPFKDAGANGCDVIKEVSMSMNIVEPTEGSLSEMSCVLNKNIDENSAKYNLKVENNKDNEEW